MTLPAMNILGSRAKRVLILGGAIANSQSTGRWLPKSDHRPNLTESGPNLAQLWPKAFSPS